MILNYHDNIVDIYHCYFRANPAFNAACQAHTVIMKCKSALKAIK